MSDRQTLSTGQVTFVLGEDLDAPSFALDIVEALRETQRIATHCKEKGLVNFEHLDLLREWIKAKTGVEIPLGVADDCWRSIASAYEVFRKRHETISVSVPR